MNYLTGCIRLLQNLTPDQLRRAYYTLRVLGEGGAGHGRN